MLDALSEAEKWKSAASSVCMAHELYVQQLNHTNPDSVLGKDYDEFSGEFSLTCLPDGVDELMKWAMKAAAALRAGHFCIKCIINVRSMGFHGCRICKIVSMWM